MGRPVILAQNLFNEIQNPGHVVTANEEDTNRQGWRVATGRRAAADAWLPTTLNNAAWVKANCGAERAANMVVLDRGHNLGGYQITLQVSSDDATWTDVLDLTVPAVPSTGALDDGLGVVTGEGAWLRRFPLVSGPYWRLYVPAMGAGLRPQVVGLWLGLAWAPTRHLGFPVDDVGDDVVVQIHESDTGWQGAGRVTARRSGTMRVALDSDAEWDALRPHLEEFAVRRPTWLLHDDEDAAEAVLAIRPEQARLGFGYADDWINKRRGELAWVEWEPLP